jgi:hypothetical protein
MAGPKLQGPNHQNLKFRISAAHPRVQNETRTRRFTWRVRV